MSSRVQHIARWAIQDWRTSKVRARSARTNDIALRTVYLEILFALYEHGGELPSDPLTLADVLMLPEAEIERCISILVEIGRDGRGGVRVSGGILTNQRVTEDLESEREYREKQAYHGRKGGLTKRQGKPKATHRQAQAKPASTLSPPAPTPLEEREKKDSLSLAGSAAPEPEEPYDPNDTEHLDTFEALLANHPRQDHPNEARAAYFEEVRLGRIRRLAEPANGVKDSVTTSDVLANHERWRRVPQWQERSDGKLFACSLARWFSGGDYSTPPKNESAGQPERPTTSPFRTAEKRLWAARDARSLSRVQAQELYGRFQEAERNEDYAALEMILREVPT